MRTIGIAAGVGAIALLLVLGACGGGGASSSGNSTDAASPTVSLTSPTTSSNYSTTSAAVSLAGSASDDAGVVSVTWRNAANNLTGNASGTSSWSIANIALVPGVNTITVTAHDAAGNTGGSTLAVTHDPSGATSLTGSVDSSLINRSGVNFVYVYNGSVTPDDIGGAGAQPVATAPVTQDNGVCTFSYRFGLPQLPAGTYTVAFINQTDNPAVNDTITFRGTAPVTVGAGGGAVHDFLPTRRLQVGPTRTFTVPSAAAAVAQAGDVIEIDAGTYDSDAATWSDNRLTLRGFNGRAHMRSNGTTVQGKGIWVIEGSDVTVENIEFSGAAVPDLNGAGINADGTNLTVCNGYFHDNENGILNGIGVVLIEYSEFGHNGNCIDPSGCAHNIYISNSVTRFTLRYSYSHHANQGHTVKSRALENFILYNRIMDEADGNSSYKIDISNGGRTFIIGNLIQRGSMSENSNMVAHGAEGATNPIQELYVVNNTFVNDDAGGAFFSISGGTTARFVNNIFVGQGTVPITGGTITATNNLVSNMPGLVNRTTFDYRLAAGSAAINAGTDPGTAGTVGLTPTSQYLHPTNRQDRPVNGTIDIGAYEFQ